MPGPSLSGSSLCRGYAAGELAFVFGQQQAAFRRGVIAGKAGEFFVEVLKAQAETEGLGVFEEELASLRDLG
jgi:hypothetical protein